MLLLYAAGKLFSSSAPEAAMASCQEGQAYSVAGMAENTANASSANFTTTFFMTIFLPPLFYHAQTNWRAGGVSLRGVRSRATGRSRPGSPKTNQNGGYRWYSIQYTTTPVMDT
jgi:hypothetical protein